MPDNLNAGSDGQLEVGLNKLPLGRRLFIPILGSLVIVVLGLFFALKPSSGIVKSSLMLATIKQETGLNLSLDTNDMQDLPSSFKTLGSAVKDYNSL